MPAKVFVGGCSSDTTNESLSAYCGQWGEVADVHVMTGKGYAFVTFREVPSAQAFLEVRPLELGSSVAVQARQAGPGIASWWLLGTCGGCQ